MKSRIQKLHTAHLPPAGAISPRELLAALGVPENALPPPPPSPAAAFRAALDRNDFDAAARIAPEHREKIAELASMKAKQASDHAAALDAERAAQHRKLDEDLAAENVRHAAALAALDAELAARDRQHAAALAELRRHQQAELAAAERRLREAESMSGTRLGIAPDLLRAGAEAAHRARAEQRRRAELAAANERDRGKSFAPAPLRVVAFE